MTRRLRLWWLGYQLWKVRLSESLTASALSVAWEMGDPVRMERMRRKLARIRAAKADIVREVDAMRRES